MNFFYDLPEDIIEKIFKCAHEMKLKKSLDIIKTIDFWKRDDVGFAISLMTRSFYNLGGTKKELQDYFFCLDWLDGKRLNVYAEDMLENKYYDIYCDYWARVEESEYYNGDSI